VTKVDIEDTSYRDNTHKTTHVMADLFRDFVRDHSTKINCDTVPIAVTELQ
jgi:hypothetical protein